MKLLALFSTLVLANGQSLDVDGRIGNWFAATLNGGPFPLDDFPYLHESWEADETGANQLVIAHIGEPLSITMDTMSSDDRWSPVTGTILQNDGGDDKWTNTCASCCGCSKFVSVDFKCEYSTVRGYGYAFTSFFLNGDSDVTTTVKVGWDNSIRVWLDADQKNDNTPVYVRNYKDDCFNDGVVTSPADGDFEITLTPGWHTMLVTTGDEGGDWRFSLTLVEPLPDISITPQNGPLALCKAYSLLPLDGPIVVNIDNGSFDVEDGVPQITHDPAEITAAGVYTVTLTATDSDGFTDSCTGVVEVKYPPAASCTGYTLLPLPLDGPIVVNIDNGSSDVEDGVPQITHDPAEITAAGVYTVTLTATDSDGFTDSCTGVVEVKYPPAASCTGYTLLPLPLDGPIVVNIDNGSSDVEDGVPQITHDPAEITAAGVYTVILTATDSDGFTDSCTGVVEVKYPPVASCTDYSLLPLDGPIVVDIDNGSSDADGDILEFSHDPERIEAAGVYDVTLTATDIDGFQDSCSGQVVVYDPSGGFVTGGGWIDSPPGAYKDDISLAGKANFGFVSKYKKGASVPTGQTQFVFKSGDLNFHSDAYDWLVVNQGGTNAQFKGSGSINGAEGFKFMLWATDDVSGDTFRIKIWSEESNILYDQVIETLVYDNGTDQLIAGGKIQVHQVKKGKRLLRTVE